MERREVSIKTATRSHDKWMFSRRHLSKVIKILLLLWMAAKSRLIYIINSALCSKFKLNSSKCLEPTQKSHDVFLFYVTKSASPS